MMQSVAYQPRTAMPETTVEIIPATVQKTLKVAERKNLRVAAYCRVSTDHEEQQTSYKTQIEYYTKYIKENPNWKFVKIFADEGLSATSTAKRKEFLEMMEMCKEGKIDLILTKSTSRFARNTLDTLQYVRMLKDIGVAVIFEKEKINTAEINSEMILQLYAMFSQAESESISNNVKDGRRKGYKIGKVPMMYGNIFGYRKGEDGKPKIVPEEAEIIVAMFTKFLEGDSLKDIGKWLELQGIKTVKGNSKWSKSVIKSILENEKYKGDVLIQKSFTVDLFSKKSVRNTGELPMYLIKNHHIPIIEPEVFDKVQYELKRRYNKTIRVNENLATRYSSKYALTDIVVCGECGAKYKRVTWTSLGEKRVVWRCKSRLAYGKKLCKNSPTIDEANLHRAIIKSLNMMLKSKSTLNEILKGSLAALLGANRGEMRVGSISNEITMLNNRIYDMVREEIENRTDTDVIEQKCAELHEKIQSLKDEIRSIQTEKQMADAGSGKLREIYTALETMNTEFTEYDDAVVRRLVSKVRVISKDKIIVTLCGSLDIEQKL